MDMRVGDVRSRCAISTGIPCLWCVSDGVGVLRCRWYVELGQRRGFETFEGERHADRVRCPRSRPSLSMSAPSAAEIRRPLMGGSGIGTIRALRTRSTWACRSRRLSEGFGYADLRDVATDEPRWIEGDPRGKRRRTAARQPGNA